MNRAKRFSLALALLAAGYVAGVNMSWLTSAIYAARVTGAPTWQVIDPLHRPWIQTAIDAARVPSVADDEELARDVESERG